MKIAIVGVGAMGSIYAGFFREAGHEVWAIDTWQAQVDAINNDGLKLEEPSSIRNIVGLKASTSIADAKNCDLFVIATKGDGVGSAAQMIATVMKADSLVLTIQNGLGAGERISKHMSTENVLLGVADGFGASMKSPGHAHYNAKKLIRLGEMNGGFSDRLKRLELVWQEAGFNVQSYLDIHQLIWEKFICNVALSGPCSLFECSIGQLLDDTHSRTVSLGCMTEAYEIGLQRGINFSFDDPIGYLEKFVAAMPDAIPSLSQDFTANRKTEIEAINGMVVSLGQQSGIPTPYNDTVSAYIHVCEERYLS